MPDTRDAQQTTDSTPAILRQLAVPASIAMLVGWAVWTFAFAPAPGWVHLFLTLGVFGVIWGIVAKGDPAPPRK